MATTSELFQRPRTGDLPLQRTITADVTDPAAVRQMVAEVVKRFSRIDILVNNAGSNQDDRARSSDAIRGESQT